ncbi:MAG: alpha/beta hydrolase [Pirellulales bacterium]|nr:alpha/beta hydrolase [Pirellulales bacterium]
MSRAARLGLLISCIAGIVLSDVQASLAEHTVELLWPAGAPGAKGDRPEDKPSLIIYLPEKERANGAAMVVCPGGGYGGLAIGHEGHEIAKWLNSLGIAAFICDYRHNGKGYRHPAPLLDAQRAMRIVRSRAESWSLEPARIGIIGFSAGGHLASTVATHFDAGDAKATDPVDRVSSRPDFCVLCYPVIAFGRPYTHRGSQQNLLGPDASSDSIEKLSSERQVTAQTPPTFLFHTAEDNGVPAENSIHYYLALRKAKVPAELHVFEKGRHGLGLAVNVPGTSDWPELCKKWLTANGWLTRADR